MRDQNGVSLTETYGYLTEGPGKCAVGKADPVVITAVIKGGGQLPAPRSPPCDYRSSSPGGYGGFSRGVILCDLGVAACVLLGFYGTSV